MTSQLETLSLPDGAVIVIGAGLAGLYAALKLSPRPVVVATAGRLGAGASSAWAQGGLAGAVGADDSPKLHMEDTLGVGGGLCDEEAVRIMANAAAGRIADLSALGVPFDRGPDGEYLLHREAAHSRARIVHAGGDLAGAAIMSTLIERVQAADHITILERTVAEDLFIGADGVSGLLAARIGENRASAKRVRLQGSDIVLATGGAGGLFSVTTNPKHAQAHALAIAGRAGAQIIDAEFVQFHPTAIDVGVDPAPLATEALRGAGATLINASGERFMAGHGMGELAPRDEVARAVAAEIKAGRGAFLDARATVGDHFPDAYPTVYKACREAEIDPRIAPIPIAPAAHYHMGGVKTDTEGRATVTGLWACGEAACTGVHGANRLASNSLLEAVVFAERIAERLRGTPSRRAEAGAPPRDRLSLAPAPARTEVMARLRGAMAEHVGLLRDEASLSEALNMVARLQTGQDLTSGDLSALTAAQLIVHAARERRESRGAHWRTDFPAPIDPPKRQSRTLNELQDYEAFSQRYLPSPPPQSQPLEPSPTEDARS